MPSDAPYQPPQIILDPHDAQADWSDSLQRWAADAAQRASQRLGLPPPAQIRIVTFGSTFEFENYLSAKPTHVVAVARPAAGEIVILRPAFFSESPAEQLQTLTHEMAHLILGQRVRGRIPAWLDEGLAQLTARQGEWSMGLRLTVAGTFGTLLPLSRLEDTLAVGGGDAQPLAYAQGISITRYLIGRTFPGTDTTDPKKLAQHLADPREGPKFLSRLWDPTLRDALEWQWIQSQKTIWNWIAALSGGGFVWGFATILFLLAYWRKRRISRMARERFAADEERDRELGVDIPPWEYEADEKPN